MRSGDGRSALFVVPLSGGEPSTLGSWNSGLASAGWRGPPTAARSSWRDRRQRPAAGPSEGRDPPRRRCRCRAFHTDRFSRRSRSIAADTPTGSPSSAVSRTSDFASSICGRPGRATRSRVHSPFCDATRMDTPGRFSPDGSQVAFASDRSGNQQLWVANLDGSALRSVTELQDATSASARGLPTGGGWHSTRRWATRRRSTSCPWVADR